MGHVFGFWREKRKGKKHGGDAGHRFTLGEKRLSLLGERGETVSSFYLCTVN